MMRDKILSIVLVVIVLAALGTLGYVVATRQAGETFTEFYILGLSGRANDYPTEVSLGEDAQIIVGIVNHEYEVVTYRVEVKIDGIKNNETDPVVLAHEEKWEGILSFTPVKALDNQKVEFLLYKNEEAEPCSESLHLWLDVKEKPLQ